MTTLAIIQINIESILFVWCIIIFFVTLIGERTNKKSYRKIWTIDLLTAGLLITDILAIYFRGNVSQLGYYMVRISNNVNYFFLYTICIYTAFFIEFLFENVAKGNKRIFAAKMVSVIAIIVNFINNFIPITYSFDENNKYYRLNGWYCVALLVLISIALLTSVVISYRNELDNVVMFMVLVDIMTPVIASVFQVFIYGLAITNISIGLTQIALFMILYQEQVRRIRERDNQLEEYNAKLMLTQVQPHFMLNTLTTIQYLCKTDSEAAYDTIADFSVYLRNNMEFATSSKPIPFEKELDHIEKYISIEKRRFGERINVLYDIKEKDFEIPALSIQPLVENAIKHGISKKRKGGTVEISTWRGANEIHVIVKDDGKGFDMNQPFSTDRVHLGMSLVESRLKKVCAGQFKISSEPDKGTLCEVIIPIEF